MDPPHPLRALLDAAAVGRFPPADGTVRVLPAPPGRASAVVAFTAHHVVAAPVAEAEVRQRLTGREIGAPMYAPFLAWLGERIGAEPGSLDVVLSATALPPAPPALEPLDVADHARVARAERYRDEVRAYADAEGLGVVVLGRGLAGRLEVSIELDPDARGHRLGRHLLLAARGLVPDGEALFAQVAPGNAASLRALLAAGFVPIGAEVLFLHGEV